MSNKNINLVIVEDNKNVARYKAEYIELVLNDYKINMQCKIFRTLDDAKAYLVDINNAVNMVIIEPFVDNIRSKESAVAVEDHVAFIETVSHIPFLLHTTLDQEAELIQGYKSDNISYLPKGSQSEEPLIERILKEINETTKN